MRRHIHELPDCEDDIVINLDNEKDRKAVDNGKNIARIIVWKNGKRQIGWVSVGYYKNNAVIELSFNTRNGNTRKLMTTRPYLPQADTKGDSPE